MIDFKFTLEHLIEKHKLKRNHYVYRLSYHGKYIIVKAKSLSGSLFLISKGSKYYNPKNEKSNTLYSYFYKHVHYNPGGRFRVKILLSTKSHYSLLKKEQSELDKSRYDKTCLNNSTESYIPVYNEDTEQFGWMDKAAVLNFKRYLKNKHRKKTKKITM